MTWVVEEESREVDPGQTTVEVTADFPPTWQLFVNNSEYLWRINNK